MKRPDALIFDIDGTLWDAAEPTTRGWNRALEELGVDTRVTAAGIRSVAGTPFGGCVAILLPELCPPSEDVLRRLDACERAALVEAGGILFPGVAEGMRKLASAYPLYLVSNCQDWYFELFLKESGLREYVAGGDCNGYSRSTKSEMLLRLAKSHHLQDPVYVGDTQGDLYAARQAGMGFAYAGYGFGALVDAELSFGSFAELSKYYLT